MKIAAECDITPSAAADLRKTLGLTQRQFWGSVGSSQESGHWFETGRRKGIPRPIRILIFLRYIAKLEFDVSTPDAAESVVKVGGEISAKIAAQRAENDAKVAAQRARELAAVAKRAAA
ncbi:hypothetical protein WS71_20115 [Burkholderia mayonis]|uniref:RsaL-like HTH domain-containing protein n=2 Tax=Burkholderia mayonis TaxID=1385591 RepID=A0A1B4G136_9BURK|nr:hypothetical protein WS71_20115 [Burkholderia mayonis]KVE52247.1 hypothetical protein WS71_09940 [Burkholderia mayonis]